MNCFKNNQSIQLLCPKEALTLGNIDANSYCPFKGFTNYPLMPQSKKGQLLSDVMMYDFMAHELNLYLTTHPHDQEMFKKFLEYQELACKARQNYEQCFGALTTSHLNAKQGYTWVKGPWPWQCQ